MTLKDGCNGSVCTSPMTGGLKCKRWLPSTILPDRWFWCKLYHLSFSGLDGFLRIEIFHECPFLSRHYQETQAFRLEQYLR